jgi:hypothetical protein
MSYRKFSGKSLLISSFALVSLVLSCNGFAPAVYADTSDSTDIASTSATSAPIAPNGSVQISPICSDPTTDSAYWQVNNTNSFDANVNWTALDNGHTGTYDAQSGVTTLTTYYDSTDPNNTTNFVIAQDSVTRNATAAACAVPTQPIQPTCIDGSIQQNLVYTYSNSGTVNVRTLNNDPLCSNITLEFSSYIMPADYNGNGFYGNPTAYPQTIASTTSATLAAGTDGEATLQITLPDSCNNIQTDLYYAPEIDMIGSNGTGTQNIVSQVYSSTGSCTPTAPTQPVTPPAGGGNGGGGNPTAPTTPTAPAAPVTGGKGGGSEGSITVVLPAVPSTTSTGELTDTGASSLIPTIAATALIAAAVVVARKQSYTQIQ